MKNWLGGARTRASDSALPSVCSRLVPCGSPLSDATRPFAKSIFPGGVFARSGASRSRGLEGMNRERTVSEIAPGSSL